MRTFFSLLVIVMFLYSGSTGLHSKVIVGETVNQGVETPHPYPVIKGLVFEKTFHWPNAGYISLHFSHFDLAPGDYVEISSPDGKFSYTYKDKGKVVRGGKAVLQEFWATHIPGDTAILRLVSKGRKADYGFKVDNWARGYEKEFIEAVLEGLEEEHEASIEAICGTDDKEWAKCYEGTEMYNKAKAVCRLLIGGTSACTGWLLGSEGHVMTNNHCISTQTSADNTDYEFMAEGATCTTSCASWGACPGTVAASSGTLVQTDSSLDYTLILLPTNITVTYGYLQLRDTLPILDERIYIPQHPGAWGKQLAVVSDTDGPYAKIYSTDEPPCIGGPGDIGYYADTAGGSSGSPVLAYDDNLVVALHHCALCPNRGVPIPPIIADLGANLPAGALPTQTLPDPPGNLAAVAAACDLINLTWQDNSGNETGFSIERSIDGTNYSVLTTVGANVTSYGDGSVAENTTYWYRARAYNGVGYSAYCTPASATTPTCPIQIPDAPTNLTLKGLPGRVKVSWTDNSNNETGFRIYRGDTSTTLLPVATVGANAVNYTDTGLARKTTYYYKVCAYNANGENCTGVFSVKTK